MSECFNKVRFDDDELYLNYENILLKCVLSFSFAHLWGGVGSLLQTIEMLCVIYQRTDCLKI